MNLLSSQLAQSQRAKISFALAVAAASLGSSSTSPFTWSVASLTVVAASSSSVSPLHVATGLRNLGNTCYLNSQLQCAYHIPYVRQLVQNPPTITTKRSSIASENNDSDDDDDDPTVDDAEKEDQHAECSAALQALRVVFRDMERAAEQSSSFGVVPAPFILCQTLGINVYEQQDSQEFWKLLLPVLKLPPLTDLYQGAFEDYIIGLDGSGRERRREEPFLDLGLNVVHGSVQASLKELFGEPELLSEATGNGWRPEKGAAKINAHKGSLLRVQGLPSILQLHLKRFQYDWNTDTTSKLNTPFTFPLELDLSTICQSDNDDQSNKDQQKVLYDLQGVIVHAGEYGSGHYYAYVRPNLNCDTWYRFNDELVTKVTFKEVCQDAFGGKLSGSEPADVDVTSKQNLWSRIKRALQRNGDSYGYGGRTSNAYVLQYIRRCDISRLYLAKDSQEQLAQ